MKPQNLIQRIAVIEPNKIMSIGFVAIIITGILGELFSWPRISCHPAVTILGWILVVSGLVLHIYCHKFHKKAHESSKNIDAIVQSGPFGMIRHPMYLGLIFLYLGIALAWGIIWIFIPSILFTLLIPMMAVNEERFLLSTLGDQYRDYMRQVPWRFIPGIF